MWARQFWFSCLLQVFDSSPVHLNFKSSPHISVKVWPILQPSARRVGKLGTLESYLPYPISRHVKVLPGPLPKFLCSILTEFHINQVFDLLICPSHQVWVVKKWDCDFRSQKGFGILPAECKALHKICLPSLLREGKAVQPRDLQMVVCYFVMNYLWN